MDASDNLDNLYTLQLNYVLSSPFNYLRFEIFKFMSYPTHMRVPKLFK